MPAHSKNPNSDDCDCTQVLPNHHYFPLPHTQHTKHQHTCVCRSCAHSPLLLFRLFWYNVSMIKDDPLITPTTDLFIASLWSAPKNEPILRSLLSGVMTDIGEPPVVSAEVLNPFNIREYPNDKEIRLDVRVEDATRAFYNVEVQKESHGTECDYCGVSDLPVVKAAARRF